MFSALPRESFSDEAFKAEENVIDVLAKAGVNVLWRDNNSDSKGVMSRFTIENYKEPALNSVCDVECRDEGMLVGLQKYIDSHPKGDILIVLHAMGSHGPAYSKRYPKAFEQFKPACDTVQIEQCDKASIDNAYDNTILYTDYFLSETIALLKANSPKFEASMIYMSDHGESLGENGLYLHGLPYALAPQEQKNPAALVWFSDGALADNTEAKKFETLKKQASHPYTHDNLFHSLLGLFEVQTSVYRPELDVFDARSSAAP
jgi:lipid A ethanolaminephosphotransferase